VFTTTIQTAQVDPAAFEPIDLRVTDEGQVVFPIPADEQEAFAKAAAHAAIDGAEPPEAPTPATATLSALNDATLLRLAFQMRRRDLAKARVFEEIAARLPQAPDA
jgi:hypothetical protein